MFSVHLLRKGGPGDRTHLFGYIFGPCLACLTDGQTGLIMLMGLALFFRFHRDLRPKAQLLAGAGLVLILLKPHLFAVLSVPLVGWILFNRTQRLLAGFGAAVAALDLPLLWFRPQVWMDYLTMLRTDGFGGEYIPTLARTLRLVTGIGAVAGVTGGLRPDLGGLVFLRAAPLLVLGTARLAGDVGVGRGGTVRLDDR